jgi:hypothetical protein
MLDQDMLNENARKAVEWLQAKTKENPSQVPDYLAAADRFNAKCWTVRRRYLGLTREAKQAHAYQRIISVTQEDVLLEWMILDAQESHPWSREQLRQKVMQMSGGREPSAAWIKSFNKRHKEDMKFCGTSGLDPKRAQAFNQPSISEQFRQYGEAKEKKNYKPENLYNLDEKGVQIGGGRKQTGKKYYIPRNQRSKYKARDGNLELVTVIECCAADGTMLKPGFIFSGTNYEEEWFNVDNEIS